MCRIFPYAFLLHYNQHTVDTINLLKHGSKQQSRDLFTQIIAQNEFVGESKEEDAVSQEGGAAPLVHPGS